MGMFLREPQAAVYIAMAFGGLALADHFLARIDARIRTWGQLVPAVAWLLWAWFASSSVAQSAAHGDAARNGALAFRLDAAIIFPVLALVTVAFLGIWISGLVRCVRIWRKTDGASSSP